MSHSRVLSVTMRSATLAILAVGANGAIGIVGASEPSATSPHVVAVDETMPSYQQVTGISGRLSSKGSDTLNNLMTAWSEQFVTMYPTVRPEIDAPGSGAAPTSLIAGTAQFGPMSREMTKAEIDLFEAKFKYKPFAMRVAIDALAVFVHKDNPITSLSLTQVDGIFSSTFKSGSQDITQWDQLGLTAWAGKDISLYGRNSASGTYGFFKEIALKKGDFKSSVKEQAGSSGVVTGVGGDQLGIGYSGIGYVTAGVKALPLSVGKTAPVAPTYDNCLSTETPYPLRRFLYIYINKAEGKPLEPVVHEFAKYILSKEGQAIVVKDGYFPLTKKMVADQLAKLEK